ncbi:MAG: hypothetical protein EXR72_10840 [Myxococcales bacterium]|nr:hypothetical protein [Myxococcales bacterium]
MRRLLFALLCSTVAAGSARAAQTVAVMPFRDLSDAASQVGEAIRETVTADLKQLSDVKVIERGSLDRILAEQKLQAQRADLDLTTSARIGKLLGATLIVTGAYQKALPQVRLTARFVRVESGEIVGTAKVDGKATDFLRLQDKITAELLRSAGLAQHVKKIVERSGNRPSLKSMKTIELYGESVVAENDDKRREWLKLALAEDAGFTYAAADLAALEQRMKKYQATAISAQERTLQETREKLAREKDPQTAQQIAMMLLNQLMIARRYHELMVTAKEMAKHPPPKPQNALPGAASADEVAAFYLVTAENMLKDRDGVLRDGEAFMKRYPASAYFKGVESIMEEAIRKKRKADDGQALAAAEVAKMGSSERWDLCRVAAIYRGHDQLREAQRLFRACLEVGKSIFERKHTLRDLVFIDIECGDFAGARRDRAAFEKEDAAAYREMKSAFDMMIPVDG